MGIQIIIVKIFIHIFRRIIFSKSIIKTRSRIEFLGRFSRMPKNGVTCETIRINQTSAEWFIPIDAPAKKALLYLHGGGYCICSVRTHRNLISRLAHASGVKVIAPQYSLAPESPYDTQIKECAGIYQWLIDNGYKPENIAIGGDSAGGGLAVALLYFLRDKKIKLPSCAVLLSPWLDLTCSSRSFICNALIDPVLPARDLPNYAKSYAGNVSIKDPYISPLFGNPSKLPPLSIHVGTSEILFDDSWLFFIKALKHGVDAHIEIWPQLFHVFQLAATYLPVGEKSITMLGLFIRKHLKMK